jgi:NAD(P)-dependent dehydrogenase (short-subunit alcohol dehydrogenase family)
MNLKDKVVLVTGGAVRLGRSIGLRLAAEGAHIMVHYRRSETEAGELRQALQQEFGVRAETIQADLSSEEACRTLMRETAERMGRVDVLVNNASAFNKDRLRSVTEAKLMDEFWPNLFAPLFLMKAFAERADPGKVVNLLDRRITADDVTCVPYLLSKKGLAELTRLAALELAPDIAVNAVAPGAILPPPGEGMEYLAERAGPIPLDRQCTPEEIADAVFFLLGNDAMTGQVVFIDGGQHLLGGGSVE